MVSIQNGLNNWETIASHVGEERTVGARVIFGAEIPKPGLARVTVNADDVLFGEPFLPVNRLLLQTLEMDLCLSGIPTKIVSKDEIWAAIWGKVLYNSCLNPLGAILEVPYGKLGENEETRKIIKSRLGGDLPRLPGQESAASLSDADDYYQLSHGEAAPTY